jgi:hypothetical protein
VQIAFVMNPTSWNDHTGAPWPGGMADALVQPILGHLTPDQYQVLRMPTADTVNVYYTHRRVQGVDREPGPCSVFVSHGIADKNWRNADRMRDRFDWVFVSGPAWVERLAHGGSDTEQICEVGYAKLDPLFDGVRVPRPDDRIRVLWAPTHGGGGEGNRDGVQRRRWRRTSWWSQAEIVGLLDPELFDVRVAPHPRHRPDHRATLDEYRDCDVVIADGGSTIYEAWALDLPVVFPSWITGQANRLRAARQWTFEADIYSERIGYHATRPDALAAQVSRAASNGITAAEQRFVERILPRAHRGVSGRMHAEALVAIAAGRRPAPFVAGQLGPVRFVSRHGIRQEAIPGTAEFRRFEMSARWTRVDVDQEAQPA